MISRQTQVGSKPQRTIVSGTDCVHTIVEQRAIFFILMPEHPVFSPSGHSHIDASGVAAHPYVLLPVHGDGIDAVAGQGVACIVRHTEQQTALACMLVNTVDTFAVDTEEHGIPTQRTDASYRMLYGELRREVLNVPVRYIVDIDALHQRPDPKPV